MKGTFNTCPEESSEVPLDDTAGLWFASKRWPQVPLRRGVSPPEIVRRVRPDRSRAEWCAESLSDLLRGVDLCPIDRDCGRGGGGFRRRRGRRTAAQRAAPQSARRPPAISRIRPARARGDLGADAERRLTPREPSAFMTTTSSLPPAPARSGSASRRLSRTLPRSPGGTGGRARCSPT